MNKPRIDNTIPGAEPELFELEKVSESAELNAAIDRDFGAATDNHTDGVSRRRWLQIMGASLALGGTTGSIITGILFEKVGGESAFYFSLLPIAAILFTLYLFKRKAVELGHG